MIKNSKKLYFALSVFTLSFVLVGCDEISSSIESQFEKGTLDGVVSCINDNESKEPFLRRSFIRRECFKKHEKLSRKEFSGDDCRAKISVTSKEASVTFAGNCKNNSRKFLTSVTTVIFIENFPMTAGNGKKYSITRELMGTKDGIEVKPNEALYFKTEAFIDDETSEFLEREIFPCSEVGAAKKEPCYSWEFEEHKYVSLNF